MALEGLISADAGLFVVKQDGVYRLFDRSGLDVGTLGGAEFLTFARSISDGRSVTVATIEEGVARLAKARGRFHVRGLSPRRPHRQQGRHPLRTIPG